MQTHRELVVQPIGLEIESLARPLNWAQVFGNPNPVELEIGMGKGSFILTQARLHPQVNYFGIEYARWYWRYASDRLRRSGCANARTVRAEAHYFLSEFVPPASLSSVHVYFPDPWPKKRHHKRRLIQQPFIDQVCRVLIPGGRLQVVTDHAGYFEQIESLLAASPLRVSPYTPPASAASGELAGTNFERKYKREDRPFFALCAQSAG